LAILFCGGMVADHTACAFKRLPSKTDSLPAANFAGNLFEIALLDQLLRLII
jgi:hypothetical protein